MIEFTSRDENGVIIVEIEGKMNSGASPDTEKYLNDLLDKGATKILLNLGHLDFITSTGLRVVLSICKRLEKIGGKLIMCNPNLTVMDILKMSGFSQLFTVCDTEDKGLDNF